MKKKIINKIAGVVLATSGLGLLAYVLFPITSYSLSNGTKFNDYLSPIPEEEAAAEEIDYSKAHNWFPTEEASFDSSEIKFYTLTISKLGIKDATVAIGGEDLADSLIQYPGTALPGKLGNAVIFGHSILPQFFNPKDYMSIFSTLPTLKRGDKLGVRYDGISYGYIVEEVFEVKPTDLEILAQNTDDSYVTLVTCTPPGDPRRPKRLIIRARLNPFDTLNT